MKLFKAYPPLTYVILFTIALVCIFTIISRIHYRIGAAQLIDGIESYQSIEECRHLFTSQGYSWEVNYEEQEHGEEQPLDYWVSVKNYKSMDVGGVLELNFFEGKLMRTYFYPSVFDLYLKKLKSKRNTDLLISPEAWVSSRTRIRIVRQDGETPYIVWEDVRLKNKLMDWTMKHF